MVWNLFWRRTANCEPAVHQQSPSSTQDSKDSSKTNSNQESNWKDDKKTTTSEKGEPPLEPSIEEEVLSESLRYYPERRGDFRKPTWGEFLFFGQPRDERWVKWKCEKRVVKAVNKYPQVKLMMAALKSAGCPIDLRRHVSCEYCSPEVTGGYDPELNQIVICWNQASLKSTIGGILGHEMLHMFDYCRAEMDFHNMEHVLCSEIRAANLFHCSFLAAFFAGTATPLRLKKAHALCVKTKAVASVALNRPHIPREEIWEMADAIFDRCYNDLEPIGRRPRASGRDYERAYRERYYYGYY